MRRIVWFAVAGGTGFLVDAGLLALLLAATPLGPLTARVLSIVTAMAATWVLNRQLTFGRSGRSLLSEGARYGGVGVTAAVLNYLLYTGTLLAVPSTPPVLAVAAASGLAMLWSWFGYSRLVFGSPASPK